MRLKVAVKTTQASRYRPGQLLGATKDSQLKVATTPPTALRVASAKMGSFRR